MAASDDARKWTDAELGKLERRIAREYSKAAKEMRARLGKALADYAKEREARLKALDDTPEAREAYGRWLQSQAVQQQRMGQMVEQLSESAVSANVRAVEAVDDALPHIYAENANMAAYAVDRAAGVDTMFSLVDESTVRELMMGDGPLVHEVRVPKVNRPKDYRWNRQKFSSAITQGILQGESVPNVAKRVQSVVGMNRSAAIRAARTATTSAENAGRASSYERAKALGIDLKQEWLATLDGRTRDSHRALDGEKVEVGEKFSNGCRFPGDPQAHPSETYNCRCTLIAAVDGVDTSDAERWSRLPDGMTYEEWKGAKRQSGAISGALNDSNDPDYSKREAHAERYYEEVRNRDRAAEVSAVSSNSGVDIQSVSKAYDHLFVNEYELDKGLSRFDEDYNIAESWRRLREGGDIQEHDLILLSHESHEHDLMESGLPYDDAHKLAESLYNYNEALRRFLGKRR